MRALLVTLLLALPALAGCITPPEGTAEAASVPDDARDVGSTDDMSARESVTETAERCSGRSEPYCATRRVTVAGDLSLDRLPISLSTVNGGIELRSGSGSRWSLEATITATGQSEAEAQRHLKNIAFSWTHREGSAHVIDAEARMLTRSTQHGESASFRVVVPASTLVALTAKTTNGGIDVAGLRTDGLSADTTNGGIVLKAQVTSVMADTTNGPIRAELTPTRSGRIALDSTNGGITLELPEADAYGYDVHGDTTNGAVQIGLRDGDVTGSKPDEKRFKTNGYDSRSIRSVVELDTTNGGIIVEPL